MKQESNSTALPRLEMSSQGTDLVVCIRRFNAPPQLVWDAHTKPELILRWQFGPGWGMTSCTVDLRVGGRYRYEWKSVEGQDVAMNGEYLEVRAPVKLVYTQSFDEDWTDGEVLSTHEFFEEGGQTMMVNTLQFRTTRARDSFLVMEEGAEIVYQQLDGVLAGLQ